MNTPQFLDGLRVLVVDDDTDNLDLIKIIFEEYNTQVITVTSATEGLEAITRLKPNILISDIAMPGEDGFSFIHKVRNLALKVSQIPAIALTALASEEVGTLALDAGFSTRLVKPFDPDELVEVVSKLALIAQYDICPICRTEKLSFIEWESLNKIRFHCRGCQWNKSYKLNKAKEVGFMNRYH
ncbi:response regulator [Brasilonema sp. UFV-L1]|uniref:response regulator n=1 Tax=Brasilonema sp. UFV-L1 TaxID=2234130 RepID=UPI00145CFAF2|nr:response regulator [Brasilonema sp. UFV-L1]NMG07859.1 response regulator [Brasilonema sp. UFV-L1]